MLTEMTDAKIRDMLSDIVQELDRGAYLHLEASELIEAIRGKHGDPLDEAGDVLLVLMSITEYHNIPFSDVIIQAEKKLTHLETCPPYPGEERESQ